jgi:hypothetical protein
MDPELSEFEDAVPDSPLVWIVFCSDEKAQIGDDFTDQDEANGAAETHNEETGHSATALPSFKPSAGILSGEQNLPFLFCFRFNGRPWTTMPVFAPSPSEAAISAANLVAKLNAVAPLKGFPPLFDAVAGACPQ